MNKTLRLFFIFWLCMFHSIPWMHADFLEVDGSKELVFPEAHGAHPDYKIEWWYFVGHLESAEKENFGYELTFFRVGNDRSFDSESDWSISSFYLAHFAITDDQNKKFYHAEKTARPNFGQAGAKENKLEVWIKDWKVVMNGNDMIAEASMPDVSLRLHLKPKKDVILHGKKGFSRKGPKEGEASYYSSFTRLSGTGELQIKEKNYRIESVTAWMDHEVTSQDLPEGIVGWDWFAIQLDHEEEIMVYQLRDEQKQKSTFSKGSFISKEGQVTSLKSDDYSITALSSWTSPKTSIKYPSGWEIQIPVLGYHLTIKPTIPDQELTTQSTTLINYWEGRCLVEGTQDGKKISGVAYVELTGYGKNLEYV